MTSVLLSAWQRGNVVKLEPFTRIVPESDGGWYVVTHRGHGWLHGDRQSALEDKRWLDRNLRGQL
jgi:hypothetical protein